MNRIINAVIRPPRHSNVEATIEQHAPGGEHIVLSRGTKTLRCTWWRRACEHTIVFLHGNSSSRIDALKMIPYSRGIGLFAFDFTGCGDSSGEYISWDTCDVQTVVEYIRSVHGGTIALWGHSMGATTALMYAERDPSICAVVCDAPFESITALAGDHGIPTLLVFLLRFFVKRRANFDLAHVKVNARKIFVPTFIMHGLHDTVIPVHHSHRLHDKHSHCELHLFEGDHTSERPHSTMITAAMFVYMKMMCADV